MKTANKFVWVIMMIAVVVLTACGGAPPPADTGATDSTDENGTTGGETGGGETQSVPTLSARADVAGHLYTGRILAPQSGPAALYVRQDNSVEMIVATDDLERSMHFNGTLEGQRVNLIAEVGTTRASGRVRDDEIELNITIPGSGLLRVELGPAPEGAALYIGELNDLTAGLIVLPDGTMEGFGPAEGGDAPVYEELCVEGGETLPETLVATTCDSSQEVELALIRN
jgi:hypothetical protein